METKNKQVVLSMDTYNVILNFIAKQPYETVAPLISKVISENEKNSKKFTVQPILEVNPND